MKLYRFMGVALLAALAACGGGGGSGGGTGSGSGSGTGTDVGGGTGTTPPAVASFDYQLDKTTLLNSGLDMAVLTVTALNEKNNPVAGARVDVKVDTGIYSPDSSETDSNGRVSGKISTGSNNANRDIILTITIDGKEKTVKIPVTGSDVEISMNPSQPKPGQQVTLAVNVLDVRKAPIKNTKVDFGGSLGFTGSQMTDAYGKAAATIVAPNDPGNYTVVVTASGVTASRDVQVFGVVAGIPDAVGVVSAATLSITPNTIPPNTVGSTQNRATLRALFQDGQNKAIQNMRVRFEIVEPSLGAGEYISTGTDKVYTDINGIASAEYVAGTRASGNNGVVIRACYGRTDAELAETKVENGNTVCKYSDVKSMTVAAVPLSINIGDNNKLTPSQDGITYVKKFAVSVVDAAGNAVPNAEISANLKLTRYFKGATWADRGVGQFACLNEDTNGNGVLDQGEDLNNNGKLEPRAASVVLSYIDGNRRTGANGFVTIQVEYPQDQGGWVEYEIKVTTSVAGSEGTVQKTFVTDVLEADVTNGSFLTPQYGSMPDCSNPN